MPNSPIIVGLLAFSLAACVFALVKGGRAERLGAAVILANMLLAPISPVTAWEIGKNTDDPLKNYLMDIFTVSLNLAGLPGVAIPAGLGAESGMPVGVQLLGRAFDEHTLLKGAYRLEQALKPIGLPKI